MIDGVKLVCNLNPKDWTNNKNLSFRSWIDTETGEMPKNNRHANSNGLHLSIINGDKGTFCNVRGSLPKYYTNGETNAIDYNFSDFITTTELLNENLNISPDKAILRGFEFGVNVLLPFDFSNIYECVKSFKQHAPKTNIKTKGILFDFQQYQIKIYDKGLQETGKKSRLMRFEIAVNKMAWVRHLNIKTLSDLKNTEVWGELSKLLLSVWNEIIFIDKSLKYKLMTNHQQKKYLRFLDVHYWASLNRNVYHKAKNQLSKLQSIYEAKENTKLFIYHLIKDKSQILTTESNNKTGDNLTDFLAHKKTLETPEKLQHLKNENWRQFNHLDERLNTGTNSHIILSKTHTKKIRQNRNTETKKKKPKKPKCMNCQKPLTEKKASAKFCSLKCKNQHNGKLRTKANQKKRKLEKKLLGKIVKELPKTNLSLLVIYRTNDGLQYAEQLKQFEIKAPPEWIRQIKKVLITDNKTAPPLEFTTIRAKYLIKEITNINHQNFKNGN